MRTIEPMEPVARQCALNVLLKYRSDIYICRDIEAIIHSISETPQQYQDLLSRSCYNMYANKVINDPTLIVRDSDCNLAKGTNLERITNEALARKERFQNMLQEKYEALNDTTYEAIIKCRKCGSAEVSWEEKQVRSADEAATLFCVCTKCKNRWVIS